MRHYRLGVALVVAGALAAAPALAHKERDIDSPPRPGPRPAINRVNPNTVVVCKPSSQPTAAQLADIETRLETTTGVDHDRAVKEKVAWDRNTALFEQCCFENVQDAVNAAGDNTDILILPGYYREEPSRRVPTTRKGDLPNGSYSFAYHLAHPNDASLVAVLGKNNITLEGTGVNPRDVVIDAAYVKDVVIRADRVTGFIARNLWVRDANEHGLYTVDSDGYIYDRVIGSFSKDYELFGFATDNGLMIDCEAYGGSDSGFYLGGTPDTHALGRFSNEIRRSKMYHNALGFSGTQGNSVLISDCDVFDNAIGISFNTQNNHPNFPQRFSTIENNDIHDNNFDIYAATADVPAGGPSYDFFRYPVGTGMWIVGGFDNTVRNNRVHDNGRFGFILASNALERPRPAKIGRNQSYDNLMGADAGNGAGPNSTLLLPNTSAFAPGGSDFFWDGSGDGNCWGPGGLGKTDPENIPGPCLPTPNGSVNAPVDLLKAQLLLACSLEPIPDYNGVAYQTNDGGGAFPCPWGHRNFGPYASVDRLQCGNGQIEAPDEDCDPGLDAVPANLDGQTCASLGQGDGILACDKFCQWDFSRCSNPDPAPTPTLKEGCPLPPTPTPTINAPTPTPKPCPGDCNGAGEVTIDELLTMVNIALGDEALNLCVVADGNHDGEVSVEEIIAAVRAALSGCE